MIGYGWFSECIYGCKFEDNHSTIMTISVGTTAFVESRADHQTYISDMTSTNVLKKVDILAVLYMITDREVAPHKCHIAFLAFTCVEE
jgi:hypothetical protein